MSVSEYPRYVRRVTLTWSGHPDPLHELTLGQIAKEIVPTGGIKEAQEFGDFKILMFCRIEPKKPFNASPFAALHPDVYWTSVGTEEISCRLRRPNDPPPDAMDKMMLDLVDRVRAAWYARQETQYRQEFPAEFKEDNES